MPLRAYEEIEHTASRLLAEIDRSQDAPLWEALWQLCSLARGVRMHMSSIEARLAALEGMGSEPPTHRDMPAGKTETSN